MPNPMTFKISTEFSTAQAQKLLEILNGLYAGNNSITQFLLGVPSLVIYITASEDAQQQYVLGGSNLSSTYFYDVPAGGIIDENLSSKAPNANVQNVVVGLPDINKALNDDPVAREALPQPTNGTKYLLASLERALFHELAHAVTMSDPNTAKLFDYPTIYDAAEAIAVAAENLIYAKDRGLHARVGHRGEEYGVNSGTDPYLHASFDPTLPFKHVASVSYRQVTNEKGSVFATFYGDTADGGTIVKAYKDVRTTYNFVTVTGSNPNLVTNAGDLSVTFKDTLSGLLGNVGHIQSSILDIGGFLTVMASDIARLPAGAIGDLVDMLNDGYGGGLSAVKTVTGNSNELFTDYYLELNKDIDAVGPYRVADDYSALGLQAAAPSFIIGASGFLDTYRKIDFTKDGENITGANGGRNIILAGSGTGDERARHFLTGGDGNDIIVGGKGDDVIDGKAGVDIVIQSAGQDSVVGNSNTIFVASSANHHATIDTRAAAGNSLDLSSGAAGPGLTHLENVDIFAGNQMLTKFIGNGNTPQTFIAGAGGGDFTLTNGDVAIGNPDVTNIYRLTTDMVKGYAPSITILNLGPKDIILIDGKRFNGNIHTYTVTPGNAGAYVVNEKGTSSWGTDYSKSTLKENYNTAEAVKNLDPVNDLPNAIRYIESCGLANSTNIDYLNAAHNDPHLIIIYSQEQLAAMNGYFPAAPFYFVYFSNGDAENPGLPHDSDYGPALHDHSYLQAATSDVFAKGDVRRDVAFIRGASRTDAGTIIFSEAHGETQVKGLNLSITGFENGKSAGGVYFSTNDLTGNGVPTATAQFGPSDPRWMHVYRPLASPEGPQAPVDLSAPSFEITMPFNSVVPTRVYTGQGGGGIGNIPGDERPAPVILTGDGNANTLAFAHTYDIVIGGGGGDTINYAIGDGSVEIGETDVPSGAVNVLHLGAGIAAADVTVFANEYGDLILALASGEAITVRQALLSTDAARYGVQQVAFADGTTWSYDDLVVRAAETPTPTGVLYGDSSQQIFDAEGLAHTIIGGGGGDVVLYGTGDGELSILEIEHDADAVNALRFDIGILPEDVVVSGDANGNIVLLVGDGDDRVIIEGALANASSNSVWYGVQSVEFDNGTIWTIDDVLARLAQPGWLNTLYGNRDAQTFDTGGNAHGVIGGGGGDVIVYDSGYGALVVNELDVGTTPDNVLQIGSGLTSEQMTVTADRRGNIVLDFGGFDRITLVGALLSLDGAVRGVQSVVFTGESNLTLSFAQLLALADTPSQDNVNLFGDLGANAFDSLGLAHTITGAGGGDTFAYNRGYGSLTIDERDTAATPTNEIHFAPGILASDVTVTGTANGGIVLDLGDGDQLTLTAALRSTDTVAYGVQQVVFDDGTTWTYADLLDTLTTATATSTALYGDSSSNLLDSLGVATTVSGFGGGDTILFGAGYGALTIDERELDPTEINTLALGAGIDPADLAVHGTVSGDLVLSFGSGDAVTLKNALGSTADGVPGVQRVTFDDGTVLTADDLLAMVLTASATNLDIYGGASADVLDTLGIAHSATGGGGGDAFVFERGYGALTIHERDISSIPENALFFGSNIGQDDITVSANADGALVIDLGSGDVITISQALTRDDDAVFGVQYVVFDDGSILAYDDLVALALTAAPGRAALYGDYNANILDGEGIARLLVGGGGGDRFVFDQGYGSLTIDENDVVGGAPNVLVLGAGITPGAMVVTANADGDLILSMAGGDEVVVRGALGNMDGSGAVAGVQQVRFDNGTIWTYDDLLAHLTPTIDHVLYGDSNAQDFNVDGSATMVVGRGGGDHIHYVVGQGAITIDEIDAGVAPNNRLMLDPAITVAQVTVTNDGDGNAVLTLGGGDEITILGQFAESGSGAVAGIQIVEFADGTSWTADDLLQQASGVVAYAVGGEAVEIDEGRLPPADRPVVEIDPSLALSDLEVTLDPGGSTLTLSHGGLPAIVFTNILVTGALADQLVRFDDGTIVSLADLIATIPDYASIGALYGSGHAETFDTRGVLPHVTGGGGGDTFVYAVGYGLVEISEDSLAGSPDNVLAFQAGIDPADVVVAGGRGGDIYLIMPDGDQVTLQSALRGDATVAHGVQQVTFSDGTIWDYADLLSFVGQPIDGSTGIYGDATAQTLDSGGVSHLVAGGGGGDTILYDIGYRSLLIVENDPDFAAINVLEFAAGIAPADVVVEGFASGNVTLSLGGFDTITIERQAAVPGDVSEGLQEIHFDDGTIWSRADLLALAYPDGDYPGNEPAPDLVGDGDDNSLTGTGAAEVLIGNGGDDSLSGLGGNDEYRYASGDGNDTIIENGLPSDIDVLRLTDLDPSDVALRHIDNRLEVIDLTTGDKIIVYSQFSGYDELGIEQIRFADDTVWDRARIQQEAWIQGDNGANFLNGTAIDETFVGGLGNDNMSGQAGSDTYRFASGDGNDQITDYGAASDTDTVKLTDLNAADVAVSRDGYDLVITDTATGQVIRVSYQFAPFPEYGIERIAFADSTVWDRAMIAKNAWIEGGASIDYLGGSGASETFRGGLGDDVIWGQGGSDDYRYASGDGNDQIIDVGGPGDTDRLVLTDIASTDVQLRRDGTNLYIKLVSSGAEILITNQFYSDARYGIDQIAFSDSVTWNRSDMLAAAWIRGDASANHLSGTGADDVLLGSAGDDVLEGKGGSDQYLYASGDGNDRISDSGSISDVDVLKLVDLNPGDISLDRSGRDLKVTVTETGHTITIDNQFYGNERYGIERIAFANGTIWDRDELAEQAAFITGTSGNDTLNGSIDHDVISGLAGNDLINGFGGNDILLGGEGNDTIFGGDGNDRLDGGLGADAMDGGTGDDTYVIDDAGDVTIENGNAGTDSVESSISYVLSANVENLTLTGTGDISGTGNGGANVITGNSGNNSLVGNGGADTLIGGAGDDIYTVSDPATVIVETVGGGNDTLKSSVSYVLGAGVDVETSRLIGAGNINLTGNVDHQILIGNIGNNVIDGGGGGDRMKGAAGDDTYIIRSASDVIVEIAGEGSDTVKAAVSYSLGAAAQIEHLLTIDALATTAINLTGNDYSHDIQGNAGANVLNGGSGDDVLQGFAGNDTLNGGGGADRFVFDHGTGADTIVDFTHGDDVIDLTAFGFTSFSQVQAATQDNGSGYAVINLGDGDSVTVNNLASAALQASDVRLGAGGAMVEGGSNMRAALWLNHGELHRMVHYHGPMDMPFDIAMY